MAGRNYSTKSDLDQWVLETASRAVAYASSLVRNVSVAEDLVQDCYCRLIQKADKYDLIQDGTKLLFRAITNACINYVSRKKNVLSLHSPNRNDEGYELDPQDKRTLEPGEVLQFSELESAVEAGLNLLPVQQRAALELKSLGHSQQEIGRMLEITSSNAGVLVHRARQTLADYLAPYVKERVS